MDRTYQFVVDAEFNQVEPVAISDRLIGTASST